MSRPDPGYLTADVRIEEHIVKGKPLGRHILHDVRSKDYHAETAPEVVDTLHPSFGLPLNQQRAGSCTANALLACANSQPNYLDASGFPRFLNLSYPHNEADGITLYVKETTDEGEPYPQYDPGGSGLLVCRAARELGWIKRWANAFSLDEALRSLVVRPVITGVNWYDSMDEPDSNGVVSISPDAQVRGGHEVCAVGIQTASTMGDVILLWNSWGPSWGIGGRFAMTFDTWDTLLAQQGDVTVPGAAVAR